MTRRSGVRMILINGTACLAGLFAASSLSAQQADILTLEEAAREAIAWHPAMGEAVGILNARREEIDEARAGYLPQVSAGIGVGYDNRVQGTWRPRPEVSASQMLFDFGKVESAVDAARAGTRAGRAELLLAVDDLVRETVLAYIELQRGAALQTVATDQLGSIRQIAALVGDRFEAGATTRSDAIQAEARVEAAQATLIQIEAAQLRWGSNLAFLLGRDGPPGVTGAIPGWMDQSCDGAADLEAVPAVMLAEALRSRASAQVRRSRADALPTVSVAGGAATDVVSPLTNRSSYNVGLRVSSEVFNGGATRARMRGADFALGAAAAAADRSRLETSQRLAEAQRQVPSLESLALTLRSREANMAETGELYRLQYLEMGTRTLVDLLNAEQEFHQVRFDAVNTAHDLRRLWVDCLYNAGRLRDVFGLSGATIRGVTL